MTTTGGLGPGRSGLTPSLPNVGSCHNRGPATDPAADASNVRERALAAVSGPLLHETRRQKEGDPVGSGGPQLQRVRPPPRASTIPGTNMPTKIS